MFCLDRPEDCFNLHDLNGSRFFKGLAFNFCWNRPFFYIFGLIAALDQAVNAMISLKLAAASDAVIVQGAIGNLLRISSAKFLHPYLRSYVSLHNINGAIFRLVDSRQSKKFNQVLEGVNHLTTERLAQLLIVV